MLPQRLRDAEPAANKPGFSISPVEAHKEATMAACAVGVRGLRTAPFDGFTPKALGSLKRQPVCLGSFTKSHVTSEGAIIYDLIYNWLEKQKQEALEASSLYFDLARFCQHV